MTTRLPVIQDQPAAIPLPDLHEVALDWDGVGCVLADLDDFTEAIEVQGRGSGGELITLVDIPTGYEQLVSGQLQGLQIVYKFADDVWVDTLLREPTGARLLRMRNDTDDRSSPD